MTILKHTINLLDTHSDLCPIKASIEAYTSQVSHIYIYIPCGIRDTLMTTVINSIVGSRGYSLNNVEEDIGDSRLLSNGWLYVELLR